MLAMRAMSLFYGHEFNRVNKSQSDAGVGNGRAPIFGNWRNAYLFVVAVFVFDVVIFYAFGRYFA